MVISLLRTIGSGLILLVIINLPLKAQGCSDAGFCSMGAMRPGQTYYKGNKFKLRSLEISQYRGSTTLTPTIYATSLELNFGVSSKTTLQLKLPYQWAKGDLGSTSGVSDLSLSLTTTLAQLERFKLNGTLGGKIPLGRSTEKDNQQRTLPMYYQTSLGSYDLVLGTSLISKEWLFAAGLQIALSQNNNLFDPAEWADYPDQEYIDQYALSSHLRRGVDLMIRIERRFTFSDFTFNIGALPIYRVKRDQVFNSEEGRHVVQQNTTGLALTGIAGVNYHFNVNNSIKFLVGRKIKQRKLNPDGLTRHQVMTLSYTIRF